MSFPLSRSGSQTVVPLVVAADDPSDLAQPLERPDDRLANHGVVLDGSLFFVIQPSRLVQDFFRDADLADVVDHAGQFKVQVLFFREPDHRRQPCRVIGDALRVAVRVRVLRFNRLGQRLDGVEGGLFEALVEA